MTVLSVPLLGHEMGDDGKTLMPSRRLNVFFYGLFMDEALLCGKGLNPVNSRKAQVQGMALRIGERATLVADPGGVTHGFLMELTHDEIDKLYSEPSVAMYRPEPVTAQLADNSHVAALCFNLPTALTLGAANPKYAAELRELGRRLGLPSKYVENIE
jgi:hypothetical protein